MYTRCPGCQYVYQLAAQNLAEAAGTVRCGNCGKTFNALSELFEDHPTANEQALQGAGVPPLLLQRSVVQAELPVLGDIAVLDKPGREQRAAPGSSAPIMYFEDEAGSHDGRRMPWLIACAVLTLTVATQLAVYRSHPELSLRLAGQAEARPVVAAERIRVLSRDLHRHPSLDDAIIISLTLNNPGDLPLVWPTLEFRLFDPTQQVLGVRRLAPTEYLDRSDRIDQGMPPDLIVPVIVEFVVGSTEPSGFDFRFL